MCLCGAYSPVRKREGDENKQAEQLLTSIQSETQIADADAL